MSSFSSANLPAQTEGLMLVGEAEGIREYKLAANGLRFLLKEDSSAPVVACLVTYLAGSRNETRGHTGAAHLLEHMMFKGTHRFNRETGMRLPQVLELTGAWINATTWKDMTNYFEIIPSNKLDLVLAVEADRMRNSRLLEEDLKNEMQVVQNELERFFDSPRNLIENEIWAKAFEEHPYHHPVIGWREDVEKMPIEALKKFYDDFYQPNNATVILVGDFKVKTLLPRLVEHFGSLTSSSTAVPDISAKEAKQNGTRRLAVYKEKGPRLMTLAHKIPPALHKDGPALEILAHILGSGTSSRLYRELVDTGIVAGSNARAELMRDEGLFMTNLTLVAESDPMQVEAAVLEIFEHLKDAGVIPEEMDRAKTAIINQIAYIRDGIFPVANALSQANAYGDWTHFATYTESISAVTAEDVQRAAQHYLVPDTMTVGIITREKSEGTAIEEQQTPVVAERSEMFQEETGTFNAGNFPTLAESLDKVEALVGPLVEDQAGPRVSLADKVETETVHGVKTVMFKTGTKDVVHLAGSFKGAGYTYHDNPMVAQTAVSLLEKQTKGRKPYEIKKILESHGVEFTLSQDHERVRFSIRCLKKDVSLALQLAGELIRYPVFSADELKKVKERQVVAIQSEMDDTGVQGRAELTRLIYDPDHANYTLPHEIQMQMLEKVTVKEVEAFYNDHFGRQGLIVAAVGDIDKRAILIGVKNAFSGWRRKSREPRYGKSVKLNKTGSEHSVRVPGKTKFDVFFGHALPLYRQSKDYEAAYIANYILGGNFSARLSSRIRDLQGVTYGIRSGLTGITQDVEGAWMIQMIVNPSMLGKGIKLAKEEIARFTALGVSAEELKIKQSTLIGEFKVEMARNWNLVQLLLAIEELGLGMSYLDDFPQKIRALTLDQVNEAIRRYYYEDRLFLVIAGDISEESEALKELSKSW